MNKTIRTLYMVKLRDYEKTIESYMHRRSAHIALTFGYDAEIHFVMSPERCDYFVHHIVGL